MAALTLIFQEDSRTAQPRLRAQGLAVSEHDVLLGEGEASAVEQPSVEQCLRLRIRHDGLLGGRGRRSQ